MASFAGSGRPSCEGAYTQKETGSDVCWQSKMAGFQIKEMLSLRRINEATINGIKEYNT